MSRPLGSRRGGGFTVNYLSRGQSVDDDDVLIARSLMYGNVMLRDNKQEDTSQVNAGIRRSFVNKRSASFYVFYCCCCDQGRS